MRLRSCTVRILSLRLSGLSPFASDVLVLRSSRPRSRFIEREWSGEPGLGGRRSAPAPAYSHVSHSVPLLPVSDSHSLHRLVLLSCVLRPIRPVCPVLRRRRRCSATRPVRCPVVRCVLPSSSDGPAGAGAGRPAPASGSSCSCLLPGGARAATSSSSNPMLLLLLLL